MQLWQLQSNKIVKIIWMVRWINIKDYMYNENDIGMNYKIFYPDIYKEPPLIVYLNGTGERKKNEIAVY